MSSLFNLPEVLDRIPVADLNIRYSIKTGALYQRFKVLGIERKGSGRPAYLSRDQVQQMDALHVHLQQGGKFADFPAILHQNSSTSESFITEISQRVPVGLASFLKTDVFELLTGVLVKAGNIIFPPPLPPARQGLELAYLRELEEAYRHGWLLTTTNLANLLGLTSNTVTSYGERFEDAGFSFTRVGKRKGGQVAWKVEKASLLLPSNS